MSSDQGKFSAEIGDEVIQAALKSVQKATGEAAPESAPTEPGPASPKEVEDLKAQLELSWAKGRETMEKLKDTHERMLRAVADLENYKKRAAKEKEEVQRYGIERLLKDFLPVLDNLDRALEHAKTAADYDGLHKGVAMTRKAFEDTLNRHGVKGFSAVGKPFDPHQHEAMQQVETTEQPANTVMSEVVRGYTLNDRLIRPALVVVAKPPKPPAEPSPPGGES